TGKKVRQVPKTMSVGHAFIPNPPFKKIRVWPSWLGAFGDTVALAMSISQFSDDWEEGKVTAVAKLAKNTFGAVSSVSNALYFTFRATTKIPGILAFAGGAGLVLEAILNVKEGILLVIGGEDTEVARALERGDELDATMLRVKGVVLILSVTPGPILAGVAVATGGEVVGAGLAGLGWGLGVGAVLVVGIEAAIYTHSGPSDAMEETD